MTDEEPTKGELEKRVEAARDSLARQTPLGSIEPGVRPTGQDVLRISIPSGPNQRANVLAIMNELHRRVQEEHEAQGRIPRLDESDIDVIEGEVVEDDE